jgi:hypothetical protein
MKHISTKSIIRLNWFAALLHGVSALVVIVLSRNVTETITTGYLKFDPVKQELFPATASLFELSLPWLVASFFILSALAHLSVVTWYKKRYVAELSDGINRARWIEYSLSASVMMVAISLLVGIYDLGTLLGIFFLTAIMNLCGLVMEVHNQTTKKTNWLSYWIGCLAGIVPWAIVGLYLWSGSEYGTAAPAFVYWIFVSIFLFFNSFALNMVFQYKKVGKWKEYLYGERAYIILSLVAKSALAWQVFGGTLRP